MSVNSWNTNNVWHASLQWRLCCNGNEFYYLKALKFIPGESKKLAVDALHKG